MFIFNRNITRIIYIQWGRLMKSETILMRVNEREPGRIGTRNFQMNDQIENLEHLMRIEHMVGVGK